ncbi:MAG: tRNA epoxyqueuosine(34) reductase QueG [Cellvibrionales bacterium]|nr:tRNA epoxyqueuosine(34) reductase QueG [Cellvibrionales bacterium]
MGRMLAIRHYTHAHPRAMPPTADSAPDSAPSPQQLAALRERLDGWAAELGFQALGVADLAVDAYVKRLDRWLAQGYQAGMDWMASRRDLRANPERLVGGCARVISLRMDYRPPDTEPLRILKSADKAYVSRYATGRDYHRLVRPRLAKLAARMQGWAARHWGADSCQRAFVDSAPVLEKPLAEKAGLGWIGKNTLLLNRAAGSWFFLGEIYTSIPLPVAAASATDHCGSCRACLNVCPTDAFPAPYVLDSARCISYLTIEHRGAIPEPLRGKMGNRVFGCDDCQLVCPWNRYARPSAEADFRPRHGLHNADLVALFGWSAEQFRQRTAGSAIRRVGFYGWKRNLAVGLGNGPATAAAIHALRSDATDSALVREHVEWALDRLTQTSLAQPCLAGPRPPCA